MRPLPEGQIPACEYYIRNGLSSLKSLSRKGIPQRPRGFQKAVRLPRCHPPQASLYAKKQAETENLRQAGSATNAAVSRPAESELLCRTYPVCLPRNDEVRLSTFATASKHKAETTDRATAKTRTVRMISGRLYFHLSDRVTSAPVRAYGCLNHTRRVHPRHRNAHEPGGPGAAVFPPV